MITKKSVLSVRNIYTANAFVSGGGLFIGAGSETDPLAILYDHRNGTREEVTGSPGGMMSFIPVPEHPYYFVTIMGLYPPFIGSEAGLYLHRKINENSWVTKKAVDLPFAHRCEFISISGEAYLVAATVSQHKDNPADWSRPGGVYLFRMGQIPEDPWNQEKLEGNVIRNHGMFKSRKNGHETLYISGAEGIFRVIRDDDGSWRMDQVFKKEVSELSFLDLDGDGQEELITIEPFHGNSLNMYKKSGADWEAMYRAPLAFGHGLNSGFFDGEPVVVAGNRDGDLNLAIYTIDNLSKGSVNKIVIEENAGPTQTQVFTSDEVDYILSANQKKNEVALYTGTLG